MVKKLKIKIHYKYYIKLKKELRDSIKSSKAIIQDPVKSTGLDDDDKTVLADTTPLSEQIKINETSARAILKKYNDKPDEINLKNLDSEGFIKLKGLLSN